MIGAYSPFGRSASPEEIAQSVVFLASDASSYTSGLDMVIDAANDLTSIVTCNPILGGPAWGPPDTE